MKEELKVGRKVFLKPVNNMVRYGYNKILESEITKVGRKYFYIKQFPKNKYRIEDLEEESEYVPDWEVYFSRQEILDEREYEKLFIVISSKFDFMAKKDLTLDQLIRINDIINE